MHTETFWQQLQKPIVALSPMDGVTDIPYRIMQAKYGDPDVIFTEFIPVEGIVRLNERLLIDFWYSEAERPVVAQIYGNDPRLFYSSAQLVCELGFDGVDINMGCPARSVVHRGCGAALIKTPFLAQEIVRTVKQAVADWCEHGIDWGRWPEIDGREAQQLLNEFIGKSKALGLYQNLQLDSQGNNINRQHLPVTVKTRIGFDKPIVDEWIPALLETDPVVISIHGRTLKQLYTGAADWNQITQAVNIRNSLTSNSLILGNGDIKTPADGLLKIRQSGVDGVLIGKGTYGNPWIFHSLKQYLKNAGNHTPTESDNAPEPELAQIFTIISEHAHLHEKLKPGAFVQMRKNLAWYVSGVRDAAALRSALVRANSAAEVDNIILGYKQQHSL